MSNAIARYDKLVLELGEHDHDIDGIETAVAALQVETPSWGFGDSGTRFATFSQLGRPRNVFERIDDAAQVHTLTGAAGAVALHFPWDAIDDFDALRAHVGRHGLK